LEENCRVKGLKGTASELFGGLASSYERALDVATLLQDRYWKQWVADQSGAGASDFMLDVGCGTLLLEERLANFHSAIVGLDLTQRMIRIGQTKRLPNVPLLVQGDAEALPFRESCFDALVSCYVAKYVDLDRFTSEMSRVAKPGARVVLYDFVRPSGPFFLLLALYIHGALRIAGWLLGLVRSDAAFAFRNLPWIVQGASWDATTVASLNHKGVKPRLVRRLSGGAVAAYSGVKVQAGGKVQARP